MRSNLLSSAFELCQRSLRQLCSQMQPVTAKISSPQLTAIFTQELKDLSQIFQRHGYELRIAGGAVRDLLMDKSPMDIDFATTATPDQMKSMFDRENIRMLHKKGEEHGTITCRMNGLENFEITTLRIDVLCDGRHADVQFTTDWYLDASRRDLTINSMFLDLNGTVYDYFGGMEDLKRRKVAFVGEASQRIQEDFLRILRYFRFYGRIAEFPDLHDTKTLSAIKTNAVGLKDISGERIWSELKKIANGRFCGPIMRTMLDCNIGPYIGLPAQPNIEEFIRVADITSGTDPKPMTLISALFEKTDDLVAFDKRLKIANVEKNLARFIIDYRSDDRWRTMANPRKHFQDLVLDQGAIRNNIEEVDKVYELLKYLGETEIREFLQTQWTPPTFPINGFMVVERGVKKGPAMKVAITKLFQLWKQSEYKLSAEELLSHLTEEDFTVTKPKVKR